RPDRGRRRKNLLQIDCVRANIMSAFDVRRRHHVIVRLREQRRCNAEHQPEQNNPEIFHAGGCCTFFPVNKAKLREEPSILRFAQNDKSATFAGMKWNLSRHPFLYRFLDSLGLPILSCCLVVTAAIASENTPL